MRRWVPAVLALGACGSPGGAAPDARVIDGWVGDDHVPGVCEGGTSGRWRLEPRDATSIELIDHAPANAGRTLRVSVQVELAGCEEPAMPQIAVDLANQQVTITTFAWVRSLIGCSEPGRTVDRPVPLRLGEGTWQITSPGAGAFLVVPVATDPGTCDATRTPCVTDCDCGLDQRCLGATGGGDTVCATPCELDRDCDGFECLHDGGYPDICARTDDRLECDAGRPCPTGWSCDGGRCSPGFVLDQATRHECACDADCDPGLRCVEPADSSAPPRCQAICETAGPWCQGAHACGTLAQDLAGLAGTDSVCGWLGE